MKLAVVSWTLGLGDLDRLFSTARLIDYEAMQFCGDFRRYNAAEVLEAARKHGVELVCYDPFDCRPDTAQEANLENSVAFYRKVIDYALRLQVPVTTIQGLSLWTANQPDKAAATAQVVAAVRQLNDYSKSKGLLLTYEACCHYETPCANSAQEVLEILRDSGADNVKVVVDSFHMNIDEKSPEQTLAGFSGEQLYSYHVSDSGRGGIGTGHIDFRAHCNVLRTIGFDGLVCFEFVMPECRPDHLPMTQAQLEKFIAQSRASLAAWGEYMREPIG